MTRSPTPPAEVTAETITDEQCRKAHADGLVSADVLEVARSRPDSTGAPEDYERACDRRYEARAICADAINERLAAYNARRGGGR